MRPIYGDFGDDLLLGLPHYGDILGIEQATSHRFDTMGYLQLDTTICGFGTSPRCGLFEFKIW